MALDIMRIDTQDGLHRYATCVASYGYMGDLMHCSESLRWMGPSRYNLAGAITLFQGRSYHAKVLFLPADTQRCLWRFLSLHTLSLPSLPYSCFRYAQIQGHWLSTST